MSSKDTWFGKKYPDNKNDLVAYSTFLLTMRISRRPFALPKATQKDRPFRVAFVAAYCTAGKRSLSFPVVGAFLLPLAI